MGSVQEKFAPKQLQLVSYWRRVLKYSYTQIGLRMHFQGVCGREEQDGRAAGSNTTQRRARSFIIIFFLLTDNAPR